MTRQFIELLRLTRFTRFASLAFKAYNMIVRSEAAPDPEIKRHERAGKSAAAGWLQATQLVMRHQLPDDLHEVML
jgi:hypothetical protein